MRSLLATALLLALATTARAQTILYVANPGEGGIDAIDSSGTLSTFATFGTFTNFLAEDSAGNIYVSSPNIGGHPNTITEYSSTGASLGIFASAASAGLNSPQGLAFSSSGNLYVANTGTDSILKITSGGTATTFASGLDYPVGLAINSQGNIFVSTLDNNSVNVYNSGGTLLQSITTGLNSPGALAFDSSGDLFVLNQNINAIEEYTAMPGGTVSTIGSQFASTGSGSEPIGIAIAPDGTVYVSYSDEDAGKYIIEKFSSTGTDLGVFATGGNLNQPAGLLYVGTAAPEPSTWALLPLGLAALALLRSGYSDACGVASHDSICFTWALISAITSPSCSLICSRGLSKKR